MADDRWKLRLELEAPFGQKSYSVVMPMDDATVSDRYVNLTPIHQLDGRDFDQTVGQIRRREIRKDEFQAIAQHLARALGERMEDEEGWNGASRQSRYEEMREQGRW